MEPDSSTELGVVVVTGASSGIGRATATLLASLGWRVIANGREPELANEVEEELAAAGWGRYVATDLGQRGAATDLIADVAGNEGRLDAVVHCAGIHRLADVVATDLDDYDRIMAVNLRSAVELAKAAVPLMERSGGGVIVNVASEAGLVAVPGQVAYNVSKAGLIMLTKSLAVDHATQGIRAISVCPGTTRTPLVDAAIASAPDPEAHERMLAQTRPAGRLGTIPEIAAAIAFAVSPNVSFMTGSELVIDGGFTAR
jgi:NAD(P)-dependent dehydrogenase (short-subunit alcohol dehydrogenase family)